MAPESLALPGRDKRFVLESGRRYVPRAISIVLSSVQHPNLESRRRHHVPLNLFKVRVQFCSEAVTFIPGGVRASKPTNSWGALSALSQIHYGEHQA